jgi:hypothetical protein
MVPTFWKDGKFTYSENTLGISSQRKKICRTSMDAVERPVLQFLGVGFTNFNMRQVLTPFIVAS